ncbi:MAG: methyltransferase domain-containing protein [Treponema sp.]|jgi:2-polyprenyl-3-methyl-5-hydroxy-6-metoxy-1,4-benzoquinol methylase/spore coat polysaccharide biosynthesis predicted glycosyltransferase SpsG|nr:methyltransferase domain-containing protein [Treponema sp.]
MSAASFIGDANDGAANRAGAILIVPTCERGRGGGHLSRCLLLFRDLLERERDAYLWIPDYFKDDLILRFKEFFGTHESLRFFSREEELAGKTWAFIILDRFKTSREEYVFWSGFAPLIGIDEGGPSRNCFDFLIDLLPSLAKHEANLSAPGLLPLPKNRRPPGAGNSANGKIANGKFAEPDGLPLAVLISFGAEDTAGLGPEAARALSALAARRQAVSPNAARPLRITFVSPDASLEEQAHEEDAHEEPDRDSFARESFAKLPGVNIVGKIPNLREHLAEYDIMITHFGLGAFEAVYARLPVILVSPTTYHEELANNAGFYSLGIGTSGAHSLEFLAFDAEFLETLEAGRQKIAGRFGLEEDQAEDLASFIDGLEISSPAFCPVCEGKAEEIPVLARFPEESFRRCPVCGTVYQSRLKDHQIEYDKEYFFSLYKKQYGKTYIDDFHNLKHIGRKRLNHIKALLNHRDKKEKPLLLDIGCAYGPFMAAAEEVGFSPMGLDPVKDAVRYVKENLRFPAWHGFFPAALPAEFRARPNYEGVFEAVTLWYVIEHFPESGKMLREIHGMLKKGGVLAFSTPSFSGISGRKQPRSFLESSPPDHWTIWSPASCEKIFAQHGFRLKKIVITGHHPERFPFFGRFLHPSRKGPLYRLLFLISRIFRLGDTFEAYGVKL